MTAPIDRPESMREKYRPLENAATQLIQVADALNELRRPLTLKDPELAVLAAKRLAVISTRALPAIELLLESDLLDSFRELRDGETECLEGAVPVGVVSSAGAGIDGRPVGSGSVTIAGEPAGVIGVTRRLFSVLSCGEIRHEETPVPVDGQVLDTPDFVVKTVAGSSDAPSGRVGPSAEEPPVSSVLEGDGEAS